MKYPTLLRTAADAFWAISLAFLVGIAVYVLVNAGVAIGSDSIDRDALVLCQELEDEALRLHCIVGTLHGHTQGVQP